MEKHGLKLQKQSVSEKNIPMLILQTVGIFAVVAGHSNIANSNVPGIVRFAFPYYSWHMPFFIFISGYFFDRTMGVTKYFLKKSRKLLLPAFMSNILCGIISATIHHLSLAPYGHPITWKALMITPFTTGYQFEINVSLWFVYSLFLIEIVSCILDRAAKGKLDIPYLFLALVISLCCCSRAYYDYEGTREEFLNAALRFGYLLFFFWLGVCYRRYGETRLQKLVSLKLSAFLFSLQLVLLGLFEHTITFNVRDMDFLKMSVGPWAAIVTPISATIFLLGIGYALAPYMKNNKILHFIGGNTRFVVYYHQLCFVLYSFFLAVLIKTNAIPHLSDFSMKDLRASAYYTGGSSRIALIAVIIGIVVPIGICSWLEKQKKLVVSLCYMALLTGICMFLWMANRIL